MVHVGEDVNMKIKVHIEKEDHFRGGGLYKGRGSHRESIT